MTTTANVEEWFRPAHQRILNALAWLSTIGDEAWTREVVAAIAGVSSRSSSFVNDLSRLSTSGMIEYPSPGLVQLTDKGRGNADAGDAPMNLRELHDAWRKCPAMRPAHVRLLDALIAQYPETMTREELATAVDVSSNSSSFANDLSRLSSLKLARYPRAGLVIAGPSLFPAGLS